MLQIKSLILNFFLLILGILLNFCPDIDHKQGGFFKIFSEKSLKFVLNKEDSIVIFYFGLILMLAKVDLIAKK